MSSLIDLGEKFDDYTRAARVYPALITILPIFLTSISIIDGIVIEILWPLLASVGFVYLLSHIARSLGKRLEHKLIHDWNGIATTHLLRYAETDNKPLLNLYHTQLAQFAPAISIPTRAQELRSPDTADKSYIAAVKLLSSYVRERKKEYPRVHEEVISYGFRRNLLGLKAIAISALIASTLLQLSVCFIDKFSALRVCCIVLQIIMIAFWITIVNPSWVYQAAELYAARLFDALNEITKKDAEQESNRQ